MSTARTTMGVLAAALLALAGCKGEESGDKPAPDKPAADKPAADKPPTEDKPTGHKPTGEKPAGDKPAAPAAVVPDAGTVHIATLFHVELLRSEAKALAAADKVVAKKHKDLTIERVDASEDETKAARTVFEGGTLDALPEAWTKRETVIAIEVLKPTGVKPKRTTRGLGSVAIFRPPSTDPIYLERIEGNAGEWLDGKQLGTWLSGMITLAGGSK